MSGKEETMKQDAQAQAPVVIPPELQAEAMRMNTFAATNMMFLQNARHIIRDQHWAAMRERYSGTQVLIVASGPSASLQDSYLLKELSEKKYRRMVTVIAVDNALPHLLACGVKPDVVCCVEWQAAILDAFKGIDLERDLNPGAGTVFAYAPGIRPDVLRLWREVGGHPCLAIPCHQTGQMLGYYGHGCGAGEGIWPFRGSNVGMLAVQVALQIYPSSVWLLGMDLCCPYGGYFSQASNTTKPLEPTLTRHRSIEEIDLVTLVRDENTQKNPEPEKWGHHAYKNDAAAIGIFLDDAKRDATKLTGVAIPRLYNLAPGGLDIEGAEMQDALGFFREAERCLHGQQVPKRGDGDDMPLDGITWEQGYEDVFPDMMESRLEQIDRYRTLTREMLEAARGLTVAAHMDKEAPEDKGKAEYVIHASTRLADTTKQLHSQHELMWIEPVIAQLDPRVERVFAAAKTEIQAATGMDRMIRWAHVIGNYYQKLLDYTERLEDCLRELLKEGGR